MAVDIATVRGLFKDLLESVRGVPSQKPRAHQYMPNNLTPADCPQWIIVPAESEHTFAYNTGHQTRRLWRLLLFYALEGSMPYGDVEKGLETYFEPLEDMFALHLQAGSSDSQLIDAVLVEDTGPGRIEFPPGSGQWWIGCEWAALVTIKRNVTTGSP
jgi:hypothetical protein